jgi:chromate transporter
MRYRDIFLAFFRAGILGFGGGPACLPIIQKEVVGRYGWMTSEEFGEIVAIANALPGPINTKMSGYIGYRLKGPLGSFFGVSATVLPSVIMMIVFLGTLENFSDLPQVKGMIQAIIPVVAVMLGLMTWDMLKAAHKGMKWLTIAFHLLAVSFLVAFVNIHPAIVIALLLIWALFGHKFSLKKAENKKAGEVK